MALLLEAVEVTRGGWHGHRARRLADRAARRCLDRAGIGPDDVDLLVNVGLYHDDNLGEPALAALIQEDIGANPEDPHDGKHGTFSFDLANGACGVLTALEVASGFLAAGTIRRALVVAGDADPGHGCAPDFPFDPTAAALLCSWSDGDEGLTGFRFADVDDADAFAASIGFDGKRNVLRIEERADFAERAARCAADVARSLLRSHGMVTADVDVVIGNPQTEAFLGSLATELGVDPGRVVRDPRFARSHTAGLAAALAAGWQDGPGATASTALVVSAGAGITAGAALLVRGGAATARR